VVSVASDPHRGPILRSLELSGAWLTELDISTSSLSP
jgi:hypothetical protein